MICQQCGKKNITKAQYCGSCGTAFSEEQRKKAYNRTIFGVIEKVEELKGYATLEAVTGHPVFRIAVLVLIWWRVCYWDGPTAIILPFSKAMPTKSSRKYRPVNTIF